MSGDQTGFDVTADITSSQPFRATVSYPQLDCSGTWAEDEESTADLRFLTERITRGTCVPSQVTLRPSSDGTLYFSSTYYSTSQQRILTIHATMTRST